MTPNPLLGIFLHAVGGLAAGSFYSPLKRIRSWSWETYWMVMGVAAWIVAPIAVAAITTPELWRVLTESPRSAVGYAYFFGLVWGVGSATFGLAMRYLGIALGMAVALGFCAAFGTLIPTIFKGELGSIAETSAGQMVLAGVVVCLLGIAICGRAGVLKERELTEDQKQAGVEEFALKKGFLVAVIAGVMSAGFAYGLSAGEAIGLKAIELGADPLYQNNATLCLITLGGFTVNLVWCFILAWRNRSFGDYLGGRSRRQIVNYLLALSGGVIWYGQFFFYGMGTTKMGEYDFSSWSLHMAFIILFSNMWGLVLREWRGASRRTMTTVSIGLLILIISTVMIGVGNSRAGT